MNRTMKKLAAGLLAVVVGGVGVAYAAGLWTFPPIAALTGLETGAFDTNFPNGLNPATVEISTGQIIAAAVVATATASTATNTTSFTATTGQVGPGPVKLFNISGTLAAGANVTTPTATAWIAAYSSLATQPYTLVVQNSSSANFAWTVVGGTGVTVNGNAAVAQGVAGVFSVVQSGGNITLTRLN